MTCSNPNRRTPPGRMRRGFTLLELLIVVGIIVILMGMLLPALSRVRAQGRTTECASNLRQIGMAAQAYSSKYSDYTVPGYYCAAPNNYSGHDPSYVNLLPGEANYVYWDKENYATVLVAQGFLSSPVIANSSFASPSVALPNTAVPSQRTVFCCPEAVVDQPPYRYNPASAIPAGPAPTPIWSTAKDRSSDMFKVPWRVDSAMLTQQNQGVPTAMDTWYGINASDVWQSNESAFNTPCARISDIYRPAYQPFQLRKTAEISNPASVVFLFDGIFEIGGAYNTSNNNTQTLNVTLTANSQTINCSLSSRHNYGKVVNILFMDGHVDSLQAGMTKRSGTWYYSDVPPTFDLGTVTKTSGGVPLYPKCRWLLNQP